jgi:hypothetical protein
LKFWVKSVLLIANHFPWWNLNHSWGYYELSMRYSVELTWLTSVFLDVFKSWKDSVLLSLNFCLFSFCCSSTFRAICWSPNCVSPHKLCRRGRNEWWHTSIQERGRQLFRNVSSDGRNMTTNRDW